MPQARLVICVARGVWLGARPAAVCISSAGQPGGRLHPYCVSGPYYVSAFYRPVYLAHGINYLGPQVTCGVIKEMSAGVSRVPRHLPNDVCHLCPWGLQLPEMAQRHIRIIWD